MPGEDYDRIARAIEYLQRHQARRPALDEVAEAVGLSPFHFQRLFRRWAGISPKRLLQVLNLEAAKAALREGPVLDAALAAGLSGPGRLHDLCVSLDAVTPGDYRTGGKALTFTVGVGDSPFGPAFLAVTDRGVASLRFLPIGDADIRSTARAEFEARWPEATLREGREHIAGALRRMFSETPGENTAFVRGTNFQVRVWRALLEIPPGATASYGAVAKRIGEPKAVRAVAGAVAANPVAYLIPCHRVLRATGALGGYRWGATRKQALLAWEAARAEDPAGAAV